MCINQGGLVSESVAVLPELKERHLYVKMSQLKKKMWRCVLMILKQVY